MSSIILQGRPGSGKTTLAAMFRKLKHPVLKKNYIPLILDLDKKARDMENLREAIKNGEIRIWTPTKPLSQGSLAQLASNPMKNAPKQQPEGYLEIAEKIDELRDNPPDDYELVIPILDSATRLDAHLRWLIKYFEQRGKGQQSSAASKKNKVVAISDKLDWDGYDAILENYTTFFGEFFDSLRSVGYPHRIVNMHVKEDEDPETHIIEQRPLLSGSFREQIASFADEVWFCHVFLPNKNMSPEYKVITAPVTGIKHARTSRGLKVEEMANIETLFAQREDL